MNKIFIYARLCVNKACSEVVVGTTGLSAIKRTLIHAIINKVVVVVFVPSV